jgi:hypothetical protein
VNAVWFFLGIGIGAAAMGAVMNTRFLRALDQIEAGVNALVAEHDHVMRRLIANNDDPGRRKHDPLS